MAKVLVVADIKQGILKSSTTELRLATKTCELKLTDKDFEEVLRGAIVVLNPNNGEILAMASNPSYDQNIFTKRPNDIETSKSKDPLDKGSKYPWITETTKGRDMISKGFVYVPKNDKTDGFWMSKYEAKYKSSHDEGVVFNDSTDVISYNASSSITDDKTDAETRLTNYKNDNTSYSDYYLPTQLKYQGMYSLKDNTGFVSGCITIKNDKEDVNIPKGYSAKICDLKQNDELVKDLNNKAHYIESSSQEFGTSGHSFSFRATTDTIGELAYPMN